MRTISFQSLASIVPGLLVMPSFVHAQDSISTNLDTYGQDDPNGTPYQIYHSNTGVKPPQLQVNSNGTGLAPGYVFVGVDGLPTSGQNVPVIYDMSEERMGTLVWTGNYTEPFDFRTQSYMGEPVLTFFSGTLLNGYGHGSYYILNESYVEIEHFSAVGYPELGDLHEFTITSDDHALVGIYVAKQADITAFGGAADGWIFECIFQEVDIATGQLIFEWKASEHIDLNESYNMLGEAGTKDSPFDWFHINAISKDAVGNYLVSGRVMDCVYKIDGSDGHIIWRLHGKKSDFDVEDAANFAFQHDARWIDDRTQDRMTLFDNGPTDTVGYSRGMLLAVDQTAKTVRLITEFKNGAHTFAQFEGSLQAINSTNEATNFFLGYGVQPFFTELDSDGNILLDVQFGKTNAVNSYRTYKLPWTGKPLTIPDISYDVNGKKVYFSWNGATEVSTWTVYTANYSDSKTWTAIVNATRTGFETAMDLSAHTGDLNRFVRGRALDAHGVTLGWSKAGDGNALFDAPTDVGTENSARTSSSSTPSPSLTRSLSPMPSPTSSPTSISTSTAPASTTSKAIGLQLELCSSLNVVVALAVGLAVV